ncbi:hypothetical protein CMUS01_09660 [Colletotrichum musicola]|uniref:F-box domain-containing protein n=1 Tax=Colletotrichum musicola TaxID=2175873 RepID=A0A8H6K7M0_9PEZI|nr:hypothetical protein CMUS01_09660 [Colletotrichum musicola]
MASKPRLATFDDLPPELVMRIFSHFNDLPTIDRLTLASANACRVFNAYGPGILHRILNDTTYPEILHIMRRVALVRRSTPADPPEETMDQFLRRQVMSRQRLYTRRVVHVMYHWSREKLTFRNLLRHGLDEGCADHAFSAREFLVLARRTATRVEKCLERASERYLAATPTRPAGEVCYGMMPWDERFEGERFAPPPGRPFAWIEIQRMWRGFWRLQLLEIELAETEGRLGWRDYLPPRKSLEERYFDWMKRSDWGGEYQELRMADEFVKETTGPSRRAGSNDYTATAGGANAAMRGKELLYTNGIARRRPWGYRWWEHPWWVPEDYLKNHSPGWQICNRLTAAPGSPLKFVPMQELRKLGVFVWDHDRLEAMGLLRGVEWRPGRFPMNTRDTSCHVFAWRSYLDEEVLRAADSKAKEEWETFRRERRSRMELDSYHSDILGVDWIIFVRDQGYRHGAELEAFRRERLSRAELDSDHSDIVGADWMTFVRDQRYRNGAQLEEPDWIRKARVAVWGTWCERYAEYLNRNT